MKNVPGRLLRAFVVGACIGLVSEVLFALWRALLGAASMWIMPLTLVSLGALAAILYVFGIYQQLEAFGGMGAVLPFSGLVSAVASSYVNAAQNEGTKAGVKAGVNFFLYVIGIGTVLSVGISFVLFFL